MEHGFTQRLNKNTSIQSVNVDLYSNIELLQSNRILPENDIDYVINLGERYNTERQACSVYRFIGTINTLFHNTLYNAIGVDSLSEFNGIKYRDRSQFGEEYLSYKQSVNHYLTEINGWQGFFIPETNYTSNSCIFSELNPKRNFFDMTNPDYKNWNIRLTYPAEKDSTHYIVNGGLKIVDSRVVSGGNKTYIAFFTPVKHNLGEGDKINLYNCGALAPSSGKTYEIKYAGLPDGSDVDYAFVIQLEYVGLAPSVSSTRFKKLIKGYESEYYFRKFKTITELNDYELYPLRFSKSIFMDNQYQVVFNGGQGNSIDIDISGYTDTHNRPLTEIYMTIVKTKSTDSKGNSIFTNIKSGVEMPFYYTTGGLFSLSDIHRIHDGGATPKQSHNAIESNILSADTMFYGDIVEYNKIEFLETILGDVNHRFNTINRTTGGSILEYYNENIIDTKTLNMGIRQEGYYYKPHHKITLRNWSSYVENGSTGVTETMVGTTVVKVPGIVNIPNYAEFIDGKFYWRDLMDIGFTNMIIGEAVDYPFLNKSHYIHSNVLLRLRRQDPYGKYGLYYSAFPKDPYGEIYYDDNYDYKNNGYVC